MTTNETTNHDADGSEMLETLKIRKIEYRKHDGGRWVLGIIGDAAQTGQFHRFQALVFADHAYTPEYELGGDSRISKFWLQRVGDYQVVADFDRGWNRRPTTPEAEQIVDLLAAGLAETVFAD